MFYVLLLSIGLLLQVVFHTTLQSFANIMFVLIFLLGLLISCQSCVSRTSSASDPRIEPLAPLSNIHFRELNIPVANAASEIRELALGLSFLAGLVLLDAFLLQTLETERTTDHLLSCTDRLVPRTLSAVGIILSDGAVRRCGEWAELGGRVRRVVLELRLVLVLIGLGLERMLVGLNCAVAL